MDKPFYHGEITAYHPTVQESLSVSLEDNPVAGGRRTVVRLSLVTTDDDGGLHPAALVDACPADARALAWHLLNAAAVAERDDPEVRAGSNGVRLLPTITLCGTRFVIDERLRQLRNVEDPGHFFDLTASLTD